MRNKKSSFIPIFVIILSILLSSCTFANVIGSPTATPTTASSPGTQAVATQTTVTGNSSLPGDSISGDYSNSSGGQVDVFSWWASPGGYSGLAAMAQVLGQMYPNVTFSNSAQETKGSDPATVLESRLAKGNPPDSWQAYAGQETIANYVPSGQIQSLDGFYQSTGLGQVLPAAFLPLISQGGHVYDVPVDIYRSNVLWYNPKVLQAAKINVEPQKDFQNWNSFFAICDKLKAAGKTCLAIGPAWTSMLLFENVMLGSIGRDNWNGLWSTPPSTDWNGADVKTGIANFAKILSYTNKNASTLSDWQSVAGSVANGDAAFMVMTDWAYGYFANPSPNGLGLKAHVDFEWAVSPGSYGIFSFLSDSFVAPAKMKNPANSIAWLSAAASKAGQEAFNPQNGTICARTDCDPSLFNEYSQGAAKDWKIGKLAGSLTFGVTASPAWESSIESAITQFQSSAMDAAAQTAFQQALAAACSSSGVCK